MLKQNMKTIHNTSNKIPGGFMSLSITNPDHISEQEISSLANVNLNYQLIALDKSAEGGPKLVVLSKDNVSCWVMFLRMFGWGALGNMDVHLKDISAHLNQFNWQEGANKPGNSNYYQAYLKTCMIGKVLFRSIQCPYDPDTAFLCSNQFLHVEQAESG